MRLICNNINFSESFKQELIKKIRSLYIKKYKCTKTGKDQESHTNPSQKTMRDKYPNEPKNWAGFVFVR